MKCCDLLVTCCASRLILTAETQSPGMAGSSSSSSSKQSIWLDQPSPSSDRPVVQRRQTVPQLAADALERRLNSGSTDTGHRPLAAKANLTTVGVWRRRRRKDGQREQVSASGDVTAHITRSNGCVHDDAIQPTGVIPQVHSSAALQVNRRPAITTTGSLPSLLFKKEKSLSSSSAAGQPASQPTLVMASHSPTGFPAFKSAEQQKSVTVLFRPCAGGSVSCATSAYSSSDDVTMDDEEAAAGRCLRPSSSAGTTCRSAPTTPQLSLGRHQQQRRSKSSYGLNDVPTAAAVAVPTPQTPDSQQLSSEGEDDRRSSSAVSSKTSSQDDLLPSSPPPVLQRRLLKLLSEGDIQLCRVTHSATVIGKILSSKFLRRWETHHLYLNDAQISSKTPSGFMEESVPYSSMKEINIDISLSSASAAYWDPLAVSPPLTATSTNGQNGQHHFLLRIVLAEGCLLLQANNAYVRDQWYHSIIWKKNLFRYHQITRRTTRQEVLLKEVKSMVELATSTPLQDHCIAQAPFQVISSLLSTVNEKPQHHQQRIGMPGGCYYSQSVLEDLLLTLSPLLERQPPSREMCTAFSRHCRLHPRSSLVRGLFTSVVHRILKHNVDFGKNPYMRRFVHDYIRVLYAHNDGPEAVCEFVRNAHGEGSACPHPRVLPNLVAVCLAAAFGIYEFRRRRQRNPSDWVNIQSNHPVQNNKVSNGGLAEDGRPSADEAAPPPPTTNDNNIPSSTNNNNNSRPASRTSSSHHNNGNIWEMECLLAMMKTTSEFEDWRPGLAQLLQPVPFPDEALVDDTFIKGMGVVVGSIGNDQRCGVHQCVLGIREGKEGWFHVICPSSAACSDDGSLWASILKTLLDCCCRRKAFLASMTKLVGSCQLLALRDHSSAQEALCLMLEWNLLETNGEETGVGPDERNSLPLQVATTLQSTESGRRLYFELCDRQFHLKELQQKGGPKKLTLPNRSTDEDLSKLLVNCGSLGNLECLSLAFTQVTSSCARQLIQLPSLRYLNLWSTQFGDAGLQLISEHLHKLQVLNLCETPVTDKGLACLASMKSLRKLNLNSTTLSASTFEKLKQKLPSLQECDVRYTDAW